MLKIIIFFKNIYKLYHFYFNDIGLLMTRSEEHTSELQSQSNLVCRLLLEKKKHISVHRPSVPPRTHEYHNTCRESSRREPTSPLCSQASFQPDSCVALTSLVWIIHRLSYS